MHFFLFGARLVPAKNVLVKNRNNDSCESSFPPAGLQKFSMNESITESKKFLGKGKSFIRSQSWSWNGENLCPKQFQTTSGNHQKSFSCVTLALNLATISQFFISWYSLVFLLLITWMSFYFTHGKLLCQQNTALR